ncbi:MAG: SMC domain-containing protein [Rhodospirillaceae bacterium]|nr:MAG: SMC domain-containing protein [Rhodospirillaceae bacterium]
MKIRTLVLENFRRFRSPVRIDGLNDGLNLICEPNESGKSTILEAMRAVLFERHGASSTFIKSLRPWGDETAPKVEMSFELDGAVWTVAKRFLQKPHVTLTGPGGQLFTSDAAEDKLQTLLGFERSGNRGADDESRGILGMLWVEQGAALSLTAPGRIARETIQSVLAGEVGAVTGGKRAVAVSAAVDSALSEFRTLKAGQTTGRLLQAQQQLDVARRRHVDARAAVDHFGEVLDRLATVREDLGRVELDAADPAHAESVASWTRDLEVAKAAAGKLREAEARLGETTSRREQAQGRHADRSKLVADVEAAKQALANAGAAVERFAPDLAKAVDTEAGRAASLSLARKALENAEQEAEMARSLERAVARGRGLAAAFARLDAAEVLAAQISLLSVELEALPISSDDVDDLVALQARGAQAKAALEAGAPTLSVRLEPAAAERVKLDGSPIVDGRHLVLRPLILDVSEVGTFTVTPSESSGVAAELAYRRASEDLADSLSRAGVESVEQARSAAIRRREAETRLAGLEIRLDAASPEDKELGFSAGLEALRAGLHGLERPEAVSGDSITLGHAAEAAASLAVKARMAERGASEARDAAGEGLKAAELEGQRLAAAARNAQVRHDQLVVDLTQGRKAATDEDLNVDATTALQAQTRAKADVDEAAAAASAFSVEELQRRLVNADTRRRNVEKERVRLAGEIGRLDEAARSEGERGPAADLEVAREAEEQAQANLARLSEEADVLTLLRKILADATMETTRLYLGPVTQRIAPYVERLLPGATLELSEAMAAGGVSRGGRVEPAEQLSRGTQEQLAVLTRIAFADLLLEKNRPVSLLLDDALVYSDDGRLETMTDILSEVAGRMQVIILTCRKRAFLHLDATRVSLRPS